MFNLRETIIFMFASFVCGMGIVFFAWVATSNKVDGQPQAFDYTQCDYLYPKGDTQLPEDVKWKEMRFPGNSVCLIEAPR